MLNRRNKLIPHNLRTLTYSCEWSAPSIIGVNGQFIATPDQRLCEPPSTLAHLRPIRDFMKSNNRGRKMPPGSAEALPPSNAKPYTPSLSNGVRKPAREGATSLTSSLAPAPASSNTISGLNNSISAPADPDQPQPSAPG